MLKDTKSSAVIHQARVDFCSRHERQNFNKILDSAGLLF